MTQKRLPVFPEGVVQIGPTLACQKMDGQVTYFNGSMPVFVHGEHDIRTFRMIVAQFCINGNVKQADICRAFGVTTISVKRAVKLYREKGVAGFYEKRNPRGPAVLTKEVLKNAQEQFDEGLEISEVAEQLGLKSNTVAKAVRAGRLHKPVKKKTSTTATPS